MDKGKISKIKKKKLCIGLLSGVGVIAIILLILYPNSKLKQYMTAVNAYRAGDYTLVIGLFTDISDFANSDEMIKDCYYDNAILELEEGNLAANMEICRQQLMELGKNYYDKQDYQNAYECWSRSNEIDGFMYPNEYKFCTAYVGLQGDWYTRDKELVFSIEGFTATVYEDFYIGLIRGGMGSRYI